jgi:hypothetical protein
MALRPPEFPVSIGLLDRPAAAQSLDQAGRPKLGLPAGDQLRHSQQARSLVMMDLAESDLHLLGTGPFRLWSETDPKPG